MVLLLETASGVSAISIFLQLLPRETGNQGLNHSCWRCLTLGNMPKATRVYEVLRWVSALSHNTDAVLFFLQWESITTVWCTRHPTSGNTVLVDSPLQTLWWWYSPHEGLKPPAQVPIVLCTYTSQQFIWTACMSITAFYSLPWQLFPKAEFTDVFSATQTKLLVQVYLIYRLEGPKTYLRHNGFHDHRGKNHCLMINSYKLRLVISASIRNICQWNFIVSLWLLVLQELKS